MEYDHSFFQQNGEAVLGLLRFRKDVYNFYNFLFGAQRFDRIFLRGKT